MKTKIVLTFLLFYNLLNAQIVNIPDINFKNALINIGIDTNNDGEIQVTEAHATTSIIVDSQISGGNITDLTGIEEFINITELNCEGNQLTILNLNANASLTLLNCSNNQISSINIENNTLLTELYCSTNQLTSLNIDNNILLTNVECSENQLTSINTNNNTVLWVYRCSNNQINTFDVANNINLGHFEFSGNLITIIDISQNINLRTIGCSFNMISNLDLVNNPLLESLICRNNQIITLNLINNNLLYRLYCTDNLLTSIDIKNGNNSSITHFHTNNNPNLTCIFVDDITIMENIWDLNIDPTSHFVETQEQCNAVNSIYDEILNKTKIYPNPIINKFTISIPTITTEQITIKIVDVLGKELYTTNIINEQTIIDVSNLNKGIYFLTVSFNKSNQKLTKTIIKN